MPSNRPQDLSRAPEWLAILTHRRWSVPVLAEMGRVGGGGGMGGVGGCKLVWLEKHLGAGRAPAKDALVNLIGLGLVEPNPGFGHPMRPEYILTKHGAAISGTCIKLIGKLDEHDLAERGLLKWTLPVLLAISGTGASTAVSRFSQIRARVPSATDRAVSMALLGLEDASLIVRRVDHGRPPRPVYGVTREGAVLARLACGIARAALLKRG